MIGFFWNHSSFGKCELAIEALDVEILREKDALDVDTKKRKE